MIYDFKDAALIYKEFLRDVIAIETPSENKGQIDKLVDCVKAFAEKRGFEAERIPFERSGDYLILRRGKGADKPVMFMAHMDTVHPTGSFGENTARVEGDIIYGPGASDCKGGIATSMMAMEALSETPGARPSLLLLTSDEEISCRLSGERGKGTITETAKTACAVFNGEPGWDDRFVTARKGVMGLKLTVRGIAAHAGNGYFDGASAVKEAAYKIIEIEDLSSKEGCTFNCSLLRGGSSGNSVPDFCEFSVDVRGLTEAALDGAFEAVKKTAAACRVPGTSCALEVQSRRPPMEETEGSLALLGKINEAAKGMGLSPYAPFLSSGGSDACYTVMAGVPTLCCCGPFGAYQHSTREYVDTSSLAQRAELLYRTSLLL